MPIIPFALNGRPIDFDPDSFDDTLPVPDPFLSVVDVNGEQKVRVRFVGPLPNSVARIIVMLSDENDYHYQARSAPAATEVTLGTLATVNSPQFVRVAFRGIDGRKGPASSPVEVTNTELPPINLTAEQFELIEVANIGGGLHEPVFRIPTNVLNPADYHGYGATTGITPQVLWTSLSVSEATALANWMPLVPANHDGLYAQHLNLIDPAYTDEAGYWRIDRRPDQENLGTVWEYPMYIREGRAQEALRVIRLRVLGEGRAPGDISTWWVQPVIEPPPPVQTSGYWRPLERSLPDGDWHGFGFQYCRSFSFCEALPNYGIAGGDMNYLRKTDTGGRTWFYPDNRGLSAFGFNSVFMDPIDPNYCLALGNLTWHHSLPGALARTGIFRTVDGGATWSLAHQIGNYHIEGYMQSNFCYDPATRGNAPSARTIYLVVRDWQSGAAPTRVALLRSLNGGATWSVIWQTTSVGTYGRIYQLRHHPTGGTLWMATQTGLWRSNPEKTAWSRIAGGLPAVGCGGR